MVAMAVVIPSMLHRPARDEQSEHEVHDAEADPDGHTPGRGAVEGDEGGGHGGHEDDEAPGDQEATLRDRRHGFSSRSCGGWLGGRTLRIRFQVAAANPKKVEHDGEDRGGAEPTVEPHTQQGQDDDGGEELDA